MEAYARHYADYPYYCGCVGNVGGETPNPTPRKYTIVQSIWTKPVKDKETLKKMLFVAALSLAYAHKSGYKVHMHTDRKGVELLRGFGYERLLATLDKIPDTVPTDLFAAGKYYAMMAEGMVGKVHIDTDVFLKKPGILEKFYENKDVDVVCQMAEDYKTCRYVHQILPDIYALGYPARTNPCWEGSMNTGVIGFNNKELAEKYFGNYGDALKMYTAERFEAYRAERRKDKKPVPTMHFDFVLEQVSLSYMSLGHNVFTLVPAKGMNAVADKIGFCHLWGASKWSAGTQATIKERLLEIDEKVYNAVCKAAEKA